MADEFSKIILEMVDNPPDPAGPIPLANHKATMFGVTIPFHVSLYECALLPVAKILMIADIELGCSRFPSPYSFSGCT